MSNLGIFGTECALKGKQTGGKLDPYIVVELSGSRTVICGLIQGDNRWPDGTAIHTSLIEHIHVDEKIAETLNTYYVLGDEVFKDTDPTMYARLVNALW